ncbi:MAG: GGDEF domain-containing protein [Acidobacteriota bacterium]
MLLIIAVIAAVDYATGMAVVISVLYFIPIIAAGWILRPARAVSVALGATLAWLAADVAWRASGEPQAIRIWNAAAGVATLAAVTFLVQWARREHGALLAANRQLDLALARETEIARTDALTGLPNARALSETLARELARSRRSATPLSLLYVDLDDFKEVNDRYGHAAGDDLLRRVGDTLGSVLREGDLAARIGGDEFVVLLTGSSMQAAKEVAARIVAGVAADSRRYPDAPASASVGVVHYARSFPAGAGEMLSRGDAVMYAAKHDGKGRVAAEVV